MSALALDRLLLGELGRARAEAVTAHLAACPACARALAVIEHERATFAQPDLITAGVDALLARAKRELSTNAQPEAQPVSPGWLLRARRLVFLPAGAAAIAATLFLVVFSQAPDGGERAGLHEKPTGQGTRTKGDFSLDAHVQPRDSQGEGLPYSGAPLAPGDRLRFSVSSARAGHLAILAVDMTGAVSIYFPTAEGSDALAAALAPGTAPLPSAIELDATLGAETVIALRCEEAVPLERLVAAAKDAALQARAAGKSPPELGALATGCAEARLYLHKSAAPKPPTDSPPVPAAD